ncbi:translocation/assembly module TamB domain-containing protein [Ramlibacter sp. H39-3-26]|uniref:translocation/assembly module TamB domain-containing protein n=1 Tax=Curvibacter soli TaxID=3031331 RepID=UPI0023DCB2C6|nr:translocation/assembly module TamB domain-containing protein [Ramlibacter sp. H39-3-26]MDF1484851.1 translocation/assembly module TamB domain-containing protein [Ramlibacter sp. H39-3-26]
MAGTQPPTPRRRALRRLGAACAALALLLAAAAAAGWWWLGSGASLAVVLDQVARRLPAGQTLQMREVSGSVRAGGRIGWLRWDSPTLAVEASGIDVAWRLAPLLRRRVELGNAHIAALRIARRGPGSTEPATPIESLLLPVAVDLPFRVDDLRWEGPSAVAATHLAGRYQYEYAQTRHLLALDSAAIAGGSYSGHAALQGAAPMALDAALRGRLQPPVPEGVAPLPVDLQATLQGSLATASARLQLDAWVRPARGGSADAMRADAQAEIAPWAPQPLVQAAANLAGIDAARLWPGAPATELSGRVAAAPNADGAGWDIRAALRNSQPGPWDLQRLPVEALALHAAYDGSAWTIPEASVHAGGGTLQAEGRWSPLQPWGLRATLQGVNPAALHTRLAAAPASGTVQATQEGPAIAFGIALHATPARKADGKNTRPPPPAVPPLRIDEVAAQGTWNTADATLDLRTLRIATQQARLEGRLRARTRSPGGQATLALTAPGGVARVDGQIAPASGQGRFSLDIADARRLQQWVQGLPGLADAGAGPQVDGTASAEGRWNGGWQSVAARLQGTAPAAGGGELALQASATVPRLRLAQSGAAPVQINDMRLQVDGTAARATLELQGTATQGERSVQLSTRIAGGLPQPRQARAEIAALQARLRDGSRPGPWALQLNAPVDIALGWGGTPATGARRQATPTPTVDLQAGAGALSLTGPVPGTARIAWEPLQYTQTGPADHPRHRLRTQGRIDHLPMAWAEALGTAPGSGSLADMGIEGDLVFGGTWDIDLGDTLRAQMRVARESGDLRVQTAGAAPADTRIVSSGPTGGTASVAAHEGMASAGIREAQMSLAAQGDALEARLAWVSDRMGTVQAQARTRLAHAGDGWQWPADAPLDGRLRAQLPDVGAWSLLAPPAWRVQGTVDADVQLSGSRAAPRWNGSLGADGLAVRSVVDGIELRDGRLRATLGGTRLDIAEFTLHGGTGAATRISGFSGSRATAGALARGDGGMLTVRGTAQWEPAGTGDQGIRMDLQAHADALRVLVRTDRQLALSGDLSARMDQGRISVRGKLRTDRAVFILPDETAPSLGSDVVVRSAARTRAEQAQREKKDGRAASSSQPAAQARTAQPPDIDVDFNLGNDFAVQGRGLTARLAGEVNIRSTEGLAVPPRLTGEVRVAQGQYRAYGQQLDVETGLVRFSGAYDNPALDILAIRPNITQRVGVQVTGTALAPRVRLYADPDLPDSEKLSWVVLGRSTANGGAEAAVLQQAALALLSGNGSRGGNFASLLGLDDIGFKDPESGEDASAAALTFGKRLSRDLYVTYERGLAGALGTLYIFYDLSRRLTLRGQAGVKSAVDLIYTFTYN